MFLKSARFVIERYGFSMEIQQKEPWSFWRKQNNDIKIKFNYFSLSLFFNNLENYSHSEKLNI